ncbi:unnamed protein product [Clonostachys chloroleuca]|uniref:Uncharacterized protein n=1 Tax=Clonostachys chloroleuca TaxID=1926264 RepID=A0AA35Q2P6_9HYPO|nr:unnamed protein product [Clonostachys chloroleuca]
MGNQAQSRMREDFDGPLEAMHASIRDDNVPELRRILSLATADEVNHEHYKWGTPLHVAVLCDNLPAVDLLLEAGADPLFLTHSDDGMTPLGTAARRGTTAIVERVWQSVPLERRASDRYSQNTALGVAAMYGQTHVVDLLLNLWDDWPQATKQGALFAAANKWRANVVDLLLDRVDFPQDVILQALHVVVNFKVMLAEDERGGVKYDGTDFLNQQQLIKALVKAGADPNAMMKRVVFQTAPILFACRYCDLVGGLKALLETGADPNIQDDDGKTALHHLGAPVYVKSQSPSSRLNDAGIQLLIEKGASVSCCDNEGNTPLHSAAYGSNLSIFLLYLSAMDPTEKKSMPTLVNNYGETLLHWAAAGGKIEIMEYLISNGSDVNEVSANGWTPLLCSLTRTSDGDVFGSKLKTSWLAVRAALILLDHGANSFVSTEEGYTPLHLLAMYLDRDEAGGTAALAQELVSRGADIEARASMVVSVATLRKDQNLHAHGWGWRTKQTLEKFASDAAVVSLDLPLLHWAAHHGAVGLAKVILAHGANPECADSKGMYPATSVVKSEKMQRNLEVSQKFVQLLIETMGR